jgi:hypothetical protein
MPPAFGWVGGKVGFIDQSIAPWFEIEAADPDEHARSSRLFYTGSGVKFGSPLP